MKTQAIFLLFFVFFANAQKSHQVNIKHLKQYTEDKNQALYFADYDASRRGSLILQDFSNPKNPIKILSEPPPDAILAFTSAISNKLSVSGKLNTEQTANFSQAISDLTKRNTTIVVLRDALYRLNEFNFNNPDTLTKEDYLNSFNKILDLAEKIAKQELEEKKNENLELQKKLGFKTSIPIYFQITSEDLRKNTDNIIDQMNAIGYYAAGSELVKLDISQNMVKYFNEEDLEKAKAIVKDLEGFGIKKITEVKVSNPNNYKDRFEVWLKE